MSKNEKPIDPSAGPIAAFALELRGLREQAGKPAYRQLARNAFYSSSVLSQAAAGNTMPTWRVTSAYVKACGGDLLRWKRCWDEASAACGGTTVASG